MPSSTTALSSSHPPAPQNKDYRLVSAAPYVESFPILSRELAWLIAKLSRATDVPMGYTRLLQAGTLQGGCGSLRFRVMIGTFHI